MLGALAYFMAAIMNPNLGGGNHVANIVEEQVINWMKEMLGFPPDASGLLGGLPVDGQRHRAGRGAQRPGGSSTCASWELAGREPSK